MNQLKTYISETESKMILDTLNTINACKCILNVFSEHSISVTLQPFKETKTKNTITEKIMYKDMTDVNSILSGGSFCSLLFTLHYLNF